MSQIDTTENIANRQIVINRLIDAPRELVFKVWTSPEHVVNWWGPNGFTTTMQTMDVRPGGTWEFIMHGPDGTDFKNRYAYGDVEPPSRLTYRHLTGPIFTSEVLFDDRDGQTNVTMTLTFDEAKIRDHVIEQYGAVEGGNQTLGRLEEYLKQQSG